MKAKSLLIVVTVFAILLANCAAPVTQVTAPATSSQPAHQLVVDNGLIKVGDVAPIPSAPTPASQPATTATPGVEPDYPLPEEIQGKREIVAQRAANSAAFDMGDGSYALVQDARPMHYKDRQGQWQRIDPAFSPVENGWLNTANSLNTGLSPRNSKANLTVAQTGIGWEPRSLAVVAAAGQSVALATALADTQAVTGTLSADKREVRYPGSWSNPALQDQWRSDYGSAEYSLRLASRPDPKGQDLTGLQDLSGLRDLELRVSLHLLPGTRIQVNGQPVNAASLPLETVEAVSFASDKGDALWLQPPRAYEERYPSVGVKGSYKLLAGADAGTVDLRVRVPWSWLAASERSFPVVLDPVFQIKSSTFVKVAAYNNDNNPGHAFSFYAPTSPLGLGQYSNAAYRVLVKFDLPTLPLNTQIDHAYLDVMPRLGVIPCNQIVETRTCWQQENRYWLNTTVEAFPLSDNGWTQASPTPPAYDPGQSLGTQTMSWAGGSKTKTRWDITDLARTWLPTFPAPPTDPNHGILLKLQNEFEACYEDSTMLGVSLIAVFPWAAAILRLTTLPITCLAIMRPQTLRPATAACGWWSITPVPS